MVAVAGASVNIPRVFPACFLGGCLEGQRQPGLEAAGEGIAARGGFADARIAAEGVQVTDDAGACEHVGHRVELVPGSRRSLKVTEPLDLLFAEALAVTG